MAFRAPLPDVPLACPRDQAPLGRVLREKVALDECPTCHGLWLDAKELRALTRDKELERLAARVRQFALPSAFACPRCGGACVASHVEEVEVDTCTVCHGVWLDRGELDEAKRQLDTRRILGGSGGLRTFLRRL